MSQINQGVRSILSSPLLYFLFKKIVGGYKASRFIVSKYIRPVTGDRLLDIGCGPGIIFPLLPKVYYLGFDLSQEYINFAKNKYGVKVHFFVQL